MKTIIAVVNFSANSNNAAQYAADMALAIHAQLHLVHFVEIQAGAGEFPINGYILDEMQDNGSEGLNQLRDELVARTAGKVNIFTNTEVGNVEHRLEEYCTQKNPFVVIIGSSGNFLERLLTGGHLSGVLRHVPYPLIVVPARAVFHPFKKVVLACDLDDIAQGVPVGFSFLKEFQDVFGSGFELININTERQDHQNEAGAAFEFKSWKERLQEIYPEVHFVRMNKIEEGIKDYLVSHPADLLLVFPKKHSFFEFHKSHAKKISLNSTVPVMSIHA